MVSSKMITLLPLKLKRSGNPCGDSHSSLKTTTPPGATNAKRGLSKPLSYLGELPVNIVLSCVAFSNANSQSIQGGAA